MLVVDHDADVLERLCARSIEIEDRRIVQDGTWNELRRNPASPSLAQLLALSMPHSFRTAG